MKKLLLIVLALMLACAAICEGAAADELKSDAKVRRVLANSK